MPLSNDNNQLAIITDCNATEDENKTLFWCDYAIGNEPFRLEFYIEHPNKKTRSNGHDAYRVFLLACSMRSADDGSDFVGKEFDVGVIQEIEAIVGRTKSQSTRKVLETGKYVYVISCVGGDEPLCKIGIALSPESRLKTLSTSSPHTLRLEMSRYFEAARSVEAAAHAHFSEDRKNGEWFGVPAAMAIEYLNSAARAA